MKLFFAIQVSSTDCDMISGIEDTWQQVFFLKDSCYA